MTRSPPARTMLRLVGYFLLVFLVLSLLRALPGVGAWAGGFYGFWLVAIALALTISWASSSLVGRRRLARELRQLGEVDLPNNRGKLGALLLAHGRASQALPHLEAAARGEPELAEWHYRLGLALLATGRPDPAEAELRVATGIDPEHAYGGAQLALARARLATGRSREALEALDRFDRDHGASPESCYRRGQALQALGQREESRAAFQRVTQLARRAARFQRAQNRPWVWRSLLKRLV